MEVFYWDHVLLSTKCKIFCFAKIVFLLDYNRSRLYCQALGDEGLRITRNRIQRSKWLPILLVGLLSGIILGLFLKWIQYATGSLVYTLLLNIDFVAFLPDRLPELIEFALHLVVSVIIAWIYSIWIRFSPHPWRYGILIGIASSLLFIPLTLMSDRVPAITDMTAYGYWLIGHLLYGLSLSLLAKVLLMRK